MSRPCSAWWRVASAGMASEILDAIERNRPRPRPLRMAFGAVALVAGLGAVLLLKVKVAAVLIVGGLFWVVDGFRGVVRRAIALRAASPRRGAAGLEGE